MSKSKPTLELVLNQLNDARALLEAASSNLAIVMEDAESRPPVEVATLYWEVSGHYDAVDEKRKEVYALQDRLNKTIMPSVLEKSGMDSFRVPALARSFYIVPKYSASVLDKDAAYDWLRVHGLSELITETVNAGTLAKALKDLVAEQNVEPPPDIFKFTAYNTTGSSKYTPKDK